MIWIKALLRGFGTLFGPLVWQTIASLGVGFVTFQGVKALLDSAKAMVIDKLGAIGGVTVQLLAVCCVDVYVTIIFSAVAMKFTFMGMNAAGSITKWFGKKPAG